MQQLVNTGTTANDKTGDKLRTAMIKVNDNFSELYLNLANSGGTSGSSGTNGTNGSSGTDGTSGSSGTDGTSGSSGTDGTSGSSGTDGTSGSSGISGLYLTNNTTSGLTETDLNTSYSNDNPVGLTIFCPNINVAYIKTGTSSWEAFRTIPATIYSGLTSKTTSYKEYRASLFQSGEMDPYADTSFPNFVDEISISTTNSGSSLYREVFFIRVTGGTYQLKIMWKSNSINAISASGGEIELSAGDNSIRFVYGTSTASGGGYTWILFTFKTYTTVGVLSDDILDGTKFFIRLYQ